MSQVAVATELRAFFTVRGLASYLQVSERTVYNWIESGQLASYKLGGNRRIDPVDVDSLLAQHKERSINGRPSR